MHRATSLVICLTAVVFLPNIAVAEKKLERKSIQALNSFWNAPYSCKFLPDAKPAKIPQKRPMSAADKLDQCQRMLKTLRRALKMLSRCWGRAAHRRRKRPPHSHASSAG